MDNHSRSASPRDPIRPQHKPPSPPASPTGFDNRAYQHDEADPNHNESFASNGTQQNGHTKEKNGVTDTKVLEAVNLELINLTPKNGSTKKDVDVEMNAANPYDEYFVPVNEHRKYMRGEKLYVTADKRGVNGGCKRPLCWTLLGLFVAAIVALIVLAATGVLFSNTPTPLDQYNGSLSSARALGGVTNLNHNHIHSDHGDGLDTQDDEGVHEATASEETGDLSNIYVPRTVEGELKVDNEEFSAALQDPESSEYREFSSAFADGLKRALFDKNHAASDTETNVEVVQLREGLIVTYRVHWKPKAYTKNVDDLLNPEKLKSSLEQYLKRNSRMVNVYHIAEDRMITRPVLDKCTINKNGCEQGCEFNEKTLEFICSCPHGQLIDMTNPKKCMSLLENSHNGHNGNGNDKETNQNITSSHDWQESHHAMPKPTDSDRDVNFSNIFGQSNDTAESHETQTQRLDSDEMDTAPISQPEPEPSAEPVPTSEPVAEPEPQPNPEPEAKPEIKYEDNPEPTSEPEPEPEPKTETTKSASESSFHTEENFKEEPETKPEPEPEPKAEQEPVTNSEQERTATSTSTSIVEHSYITPTFIAPEESQSEEQTTAKPEPTPEPEPTSEPEPTPKPEPTPEPEPTAEPEPTSEPAPADHEHTNQTTSTSDFSENSFYIESDRKPEPEPVPVTEESKTATVMDSSHELEKVIYGEKSSMYTEDGNLYNDFGNSNDTSRTTKVVRVSISEPSIGNEPKSEIISNVSDATSSTISTDEIKTTTESDTWLEDQENSMKYFPSVKEHADTKIYADILNNKINKGMGESEHRSFHNFDDNDFLFDTTTYGTTSIDINNEKTLSKINNDSSETAVTETENTNVKTEAEETPAITLQKTESIYEEGSKEVADITTISPIVSVITEKSIHVENKPDIEIRTEVSTITENSMTLEAKESLNSTLEPKQDSEVSVSDLISEPVTEVGDDIITKKHEGLNDANEMDILDKKSFGESKENSTDSEEGMDITFDSINMLYNRSSKSIEDQSKSSNHITVSGTVEKNDATGTVTVSDNRALNAQATTENGGTKFDEILRQVSSKDDFEPDYLNNLSTVSKPVEEPLYTMGQDYENDNFKKFNKKDTTKTDESVIDISNENLNINNMPTMSIPVETTTVSEYIYKVKELSVQEPESTLVEHNNSFNLPSTTSAPAPVWEEFESDRNLKVQDINTKDDAAIQIGDIITNENTITPVFTTTLAPSSTTIELTTNSNNDNSTPDADLLNSLALNTTQSNNLNVTIYEISSHNDNNSSAVKPNSHSTEYDDHETEMNPFLPDIENNKSLVKKLQEGHDIEPANLNETQNETTEDHHLVTVTHEQSNSTSPSITFETKTETEEEDTKAVAALETSFHDLLSNMNSEETNSNDAKTVNEKENLKSINTEEPQTIPISTFLVDTDDLVTTKEPSTTLSDIKLENEATSTIVSDTKLETEATSTTLSDIRLDNEATSTLAPTSTIVNTAQYLDVVPITNMPKNLKSEISQHINDITNKSDLSKSDKRTFETTKYDSVLNNEA